MLAATEEPHETRHYHSEAELLVAEARLDCGDWHYGAFDWGSVVGAAGSGIGNHRAGTRDTRN